MVRKVVNMNYTNYGILSSNGKNDVPYVSNISALSEENQEKVVVLAQALKVAESNNLTLLTKDRNEVDEMVNGFLILSRNLEVRYNSELPKLKKQAEEILALLTKRQP